MKITLLAIGLLTIGFVNAWYATGHMASKLKLKF